MSLLTVSGLRVGFGSTEVLPNLSYAVEPGQVLGIVGESGSGKTISALAVLRLLPPAARILGGEVLLDGENLVEASEKRMREIRGGRIGMVFQDPTTALNPVMRIGRQIDEVLELHRPGISRRGARRRTLDVLRLVGVPDPERRAEEYPHQWSGGMRQRAVIAMALANEPELVIADEPTTALDATVQAQVLQVLLDARESRGCAIVLITHDLGIVADVADEVVVMYAGRVAESCDVETLFTGSRHPYTRALMRSRPGWAAKSERLQPIPGKPPDLASPPSGCPFHPRCPAADGDPRCADVLPPLELLGGDHRTACHHHDRLP